MKKQFERKAPLRVAVYARVGNDSQAPQEGEPVRFHSDKQGLLDAARAGQVDHLLVEGFTGLGRNMAESLVLLRELSSAGVKVSLLREGRVV